MLIIVTGASSGFGYHISKQLIQHGHRVIGIARRVEHLQHLQQELGRDFFSLALDLSQPYVYLEEKFKSIPERFVLENVDVLINNAGLALGLERADNAQIDDWNQMVDVNIKGVLAMTKLVLPFMVKKKSGYIINMGSIAGSYPYPRGHVYGATKAFIKQFSLNLRADLAGMGIRVSNVEPGLSAGTEFSYVRFRGDTERVKALYEEVDAIQPEDIANTVLWLISQPKHININRIEIMPISQSSSALDVVKGSVYADKFVSP